MEEVVPGVLIILCNVKIANLSIGFLVLSLKVNSMFWKTHEV